MKGTVDKLLNFMKLSDDEEYDEEYEEYEDDEEEEEEPRSTFSFFKKKEPEVEEESSNQNISGLKSHTVHRFIDGLNDRRAGVMGVEGRASGGGIFLRGQQFF